MEDGQLGFWAVVKAALLSPRALFEAAAAGRVRTRPFWVFLVGIVVGSVSTGLELSRANGHGVAALGAAFGVLGLLLSPLGWFIEVAISHWVLRLLGARGSLGDTKLAVGLSSAPRLLGVVPIPYIAVGVELWTLALKVHGLGALHRVKAWRVGLAVVATIALPLLLSLGIRAYALEAFRIPSNSMFPTLQIGDHLFVSKSAYGVVTPSLPQRGDVVVFRYPDPRDSAEPMDFVKRVVGLPGDELEFESDAPIINGWRVPRCSLGAVRVNDGSGDVAYEVFVEFLAGRSYLVASEAGRNEVKQGPYRVAPQQFWVVGDNRSNSSDSRSWLALAKSRAYQRGVELDDAEAGGGVPVANLKGRGSWLWLPVTRIGADANGAPELPWSIAHLKPLLDDCLARAPDLGHSTPPPPRRQ